MDKADRHENIFMRTALSCGSFTSAYSVAILPFFALYCAIHAHIAVTACIVLACLIPFAVMPLVYAAMHRFSPLLFGRYHLFLPISAFSAAFCFVLMFSSLDGTPSEQCLIFFGSVLFASAIACYRYSSFSVRVRLDGSDFGMSVEGKALAALGAASALACIGGFYAYDPSTMFINTAYVLAALCSIWAIAQYLTTFYSVPKFSGSRKMTVKQAFRSVYYGLDKMTFFAAVCAMGACTTVIALSAYFCIIWGMPAYAPLVAATAAVCGYAIAAAGLCRMNNNAVVAAVAFGLSVIAIVVFIIVSAVKVSAPAAVAFDTTACFFAGGGLAAAVAVKRRRFVAVKPRNTVGTAFILSGLADYGGCAIATAVCAAAIGSVTYDVMPTKLVSIVSYALAAAIAVVGFALTLVGAKREPGEETLPKDELGAQDDGAHGV